MNDLNSDRNWFGGLNSWNWYIDENFFSEKRAKQRKMLKFFAEETCKTAQNAKFLRCAKTRKTAQTAQNAKFSQSAKQRKMRKISDSQRKNSAKTAEFRREKQRKNKAQICTMHTWVTRNKIFYQHNSSSCLSANYFPGQIGGKNRWFLNSGTFREKKAK